MVDRFLASLGVTETTLSPDETQALDEQGYLVLTSVMDAAWLQSLRELFEARAADEHAAGVRQQGTRHVGGVDLSAEAVRRVYAHPRLLAAAYHILGRPFRLNGVEGRDPLPGHGLQGIHSDAVPRQPGEPYTIVTSIWMLDGFTAANGATRLVPGSHRLTGKQPKAAGDPNRPFPGEVVIEAPAGSALIFNGHLLHGGTRNTAGRPRRALICKFEPRDRPRPWGAEAPEEHERLPAEMRCRG